MKVWMDSNVVLGCGEWGPGYWLLWLEKIKIEVKEKVNVKVNKEKV